MTEPELCGGVGVGQQQLGIDRPPQGLEHRAIGQAGDPREQRPVEPAPHDRGATTTTTTTTTPAASPRIARRLRSVSAKVNGTPG